MAAERRLGMTRGMGSVTGAESKHDGTRPTEYPNDLLEWRR